MCGKKCWANLTVLLDGFHTSKHVVTLFWTLHPSNTVCLHLINRRPLYKQDWIKSHWYIHIAYQHYSTATITINTTSIVSVGVCNVIDNSYVEEAVCPELGGGAIWDIEANVHTWKNCCEYNVVLHCPQWIWWQIIDMCFGKIIAYPIKFDMSSLTNQI